MPTENTPGALAGFTYRVLIAVGIIALAVLVWRLSSVLVIVFGGIILAAALRALTNFAVRYTPLSDRWALGLVVLLVLGLLLLAGWLIGAPSFRLGPHRGRRRRG